MEILINKPFEVSIKKWPEFKLECIVIDNNNGTGIDKNKIKNLNTGNIFFVEDQWFDEELTGRKITYK